MKTIIAGSRGFSNYALLSSTLEAIHQASPITLAVCGEARGADRLGKIWARLNAIPVASRPANWTQFGKAAGYIRNEDMARESDRLIAFWDGVSPGTRHMINLARTYNLKVHVCFYALNLLLEDTMDNPVHLNNPHLAYAGGAK